MNAALGEAGVILAFIGAVVGAGSLVYGLVARRDAAVRLGSRYHWAILVGALVAVVAMERALITHDFSLEFVARNNSVDTPLLYTIAGMWSALEGSILLWAFVLALYTTAMCVRFASRRSDAMVGWATVAAYVVAAFFFGLMLGPADPFRSVSGGVVPLDGAGPNPLLQNHPLMAFHPPLLYAGYVGFTIPFAFGIAALVTGRLGEGWLVEVRRWALFAWACLTAGILLGAWWSYEVLGWGGYWAWDPVENASLLPWLTATAYLHSVMVQERRAMLRIWNLSLLAATFSLTILGTFFTRSGVLESVHAFSDSPLGPVLLGAFAAVVIVTCALIFWRGDRLGSPGSIASPLSREAAFLGNNLAFAAFAFVVLLGTVFPLIAEAIDGERISVGRPYFDGMVRPIAFVLLFLMAVAAVLPWRGTTASAVADRLFGPAAFATLVVVACVVSGVRGLWPLVTFALAAFVAATSLRRLAGAVRRQGARALTGRAGGGMVAHVGIAVVAVALAASGSYATRAEVQLRTGETVSVAGHRLTLEAIRAEEHPNRSAIVADIDVDGEGVYSPSLSRFPNSTDAIGAPSVRTGFREDVYLTLVRSPASEGQPAVISVIVQPLVAWLWIGGGMVVVGAVLALVSWRRGGGPGVDVPRRAPDAESVRREPEPVMS